MQGNFERARSWMVDAIRPCLLWPGYVATERMTQLMETDPAVKQLKEKMGFESTELSGRVIRALYDDPNLLTLSGKTIITAEAAERYGISDLDGYEPKSLRWIYRGPHPAFDIPQERSRFATAPYIPANATILDGSSTNLTSQD